GILEMIQAAEESPIDIYYGIPSSVPSTSQNLETTGGIIDCQAMKHLLAEKDIICVWEIMNYR
ncbi:MAG TPA: adenosine deaminase, partial [Lachnospiraceae bacterium]|nr:adenosine deaminase [Lachnospiraceae bacterium]